MKSDSAGLSFPRNEINRRQFLAGAAAGVAVWGTLKPALGEEGPRRKAAIIGHTGQGNYGHGHDLIFQGREDIQVVAVADADPDGMAQAVERIGASRGYADYRVMLDKERPELVSVTPRWTDQHFAMGMRALEVGAHVYMEKPFTQSLAEADALLAKADASGLKIVVAHQMRLAPGILHLQRRLAEGLIGDLLQIHSHGKQDRRAGAEDMMVLGTHLFDLVRFWAGDAQWCTARIRQNGRPATREAIHQATENIGPIVGDDIEAQFGFENGVVANFTSRGAYREAAGHWGMQLVGTKGRVRIFMDMEPRIFWAKSVAWTDTGGTLQWTRVEGDPTWGLPASERGFPAANRRVVDDWLEAMAQGRTPICSGYAAMKSLEMIMAVFEAGLSGRRVEIPLMKREHPLIRG